jgi:DNA-binding HxlR family transcriptional regulator
MGKTSDSPLCPRFHHAVELIGRRWTGAILFLLLRGPTRYSDLRDAIPGITDPMLSARLQELEAEGVVERSVLPGAPVRVQYALTVKGQGLSDVMGAIGEWSDRWVPLSRPEPAAEPRRAAKTAMRRPASRKVAAGGPARTRRTSRV